MATQFITNDKGEKMAVILPISEYEDLLRQHHLNLDLTDEYKTIIDLMIADEKSGGAIYVSFADVKSRFLHK